MEIKIDLGKFCRCHCRNCDYEEWADRPPHSYPAKCPICGASNMGMGRRSFGVPYSYCDENPHSYNVLDSSQREYQVYFFTPDAERKSHGFTVGDENPRDLCEDISDPYIAIDWVIDRLRELYLFSSQIDKAVRVKELLEKTREDDEVRIMKKKAYDQKVKLAELADEYVELMEEIEHLEGREYA